MPKQSQRILVSPLYNFPLRRETGNLNQMQTSAINCVCEFRFSSQNIFVLINENAAETVCETKACVKRRSNCTTVPRLLSMIVGASQIKFIPLLFNFLWCSAMLRLTSTTHKNSKVSKCLQCWQTEWQRSCRTQSCRFIAQKGSIRFTKLPLLCNSVHANSYTKTKAQEVFFHCYISSCCTELHETCTKHKMSKLHTFSACPLLASSDRNADLS